MGKGLLVRLWKSLQGKAVNAIKPGFSPGFTGGKIEKRYLAFLADFIIAGLHPNSNDNCIKIMLTKD